MEKVYSRPESLDISNNKFCPGCMHSTFIKICMQVIDELGIGDGSGHPAHRVCQQ